MKLVLAPDWFLGFDVLIEIFSFIILALFFWLCARYYKINKKKSFLYLGIGFLLVAIAQIATILTKLVLYYDTTFTQTIGQQLVLTYKVVKSVDIFYYIGFFFNRLLTLLGFYIIYRLPTKKIFSEEFLLAFYFIILSAAFSIFAEQLFHLTVIILLAMITYNYYKIYKKNKAENTRILLVAFSMLTFAHLIFLISKSGMLYVVSNIIELCSFIILLMLIVRILRHKS